MGRPDAGDGRRGRTAARRRARRRARRAGARRRPGAAAAGRTGAATAAAAGRGGSTRDRARRVLAAAGGDDPLGGAGAEPAPARVASVDRGRRRRRRGLGAAPEPRAATSAARGVGRRGRRRGRVSAAAGAGASAGAGGRGGRPRLGAGRLLGGLGRLRGLGRLGRLLVGLGRLLVADQALALGLAPDAVGLGVDHTRRVRLDADPERLAEIERLLVGQPELSRQLIHADVSSQERFQFLVTDAGRSAEVAAMGNSMVEMSGVGRAGASDGASILARPYGQHEVRWRLRGGRACRREPVRRRPRRPR